MGISFRLLSVEDIGDLRELLENDGMLYHPQYLAHFLCHPELALSARSKKIDRWEWPAVISCRGWMERPCFFCIRWTFYPLSKDVELTAVFMVWLADYDRKLRCSELFVITDKENPRACRVYEKAGGKSEYDNEVVYVIDYEKVENGEDGA